MKTITTLCYMRLWAFRLAAFTALAGSVFDLCRPLWTKGCAVCVARFGLLIAGRAVPLSWLGLGGAGLLLLLSFCPGSRALRLRTILALLGGGLALWLLLVQAVVLRSFCPTCTVVDGALLMAALVEAARQPALAATPAPYGPRRYSGGTASTSQTPLSDR